MEVYLKLSYEKMGWQVEIDPSTIPNFIPVKRIRRSGETENHWLNPAYIVSVQEKTDLSYDMGTPGPLAA